MFAIQKNGFQPQVFGGPVMRFARQQINFRQPLRVSTAITEGMRALASALGGRMEVATDHCVQRVRDLTEARLTRARSQGENLPRFTRAGQSFITLLWVLLVDGLLPQRPPGVVRAWLIEVIQATDLFEDPLTDEHLPALIQLFSETVAFNEGLPAPAPDAIARTLRQVWAAASPQTDGNARRLPGVGTARLFVGRAADVAVLDQRLGITDRAARRPLTIVRGWPGVGKTALINVIAVDERVQNAFQDGVLWAAVGQGGSLTDVFRDWAKQLGALHLLAVQKFSELLAGMRQVLAGRDLLVVADDLWEAEQGLYLKQVVDLRTNTVLLTTRFTDVANRLRDLPDDIYVLEALTEPYAIELLTLLAPEPVRQYQARMPGLVRALEGLPLALRVAGPMLQYYHETHFDIPELLDEFEHDYNRLLEASAPGDRIDEATGQTPTIELLFQRSIDTLSQEARLAFAALGVFRHKPATFDAPALQAVWEADDPKSLIATLIGRGLMDTAPERRYRVHQTLHMYARKLLDRYDAGQSL